MNMLVETFFQMAVVLFGALATTTCALLYFRRVRLERPSVGVFNPRDIAILLFFITALPLLYLILPSIALTGILVITFVSALYLALRPFLRPLYLWPLIALLIIADIVVTETMLGTRQGWQVYWVITSCVVLVAAVGVSNLYVQGGMRLQYIAWFTLLLAGYDTFFNVVIPISLKLADRFEGQPLDPSIGFTMSVYTGNIGIGDLLVYSLFIIAAYKGFGKRGVIASFIIIPIFGAILPALSPLFIANFVRQNIGIVVPAQAFFGPAAFVTYFLLARGTRERSMAQWMSAQAAAGHEPIRVSRRQAIPALATAEVRESLPTAEVGAQQAG